MRLKLYLTAIFLALSLLRLNSQPIVTVRFSNPEFTCATQNYTVDVEFQSNTPNVQLFGMNVRFYYPDNVLEYITFGEFVDGYGAVDPDPPIINTGSSNSGMILFGFPGPFEFINGAIQKIGESDLVLSTTGWTKIFNVSFHVDDTNAFNTLNFCPSLIWDLREDLSGGFPEGSQGVVITIVNGNGSAPSIEHVVQFNWQYDGVPGYPFGYPVQTNCISTVCGYAPKNYLPTYGDAYPGEINIPVNVVDFENIGSFSLAFEYDTLVLAYIDHTENAIFNSTNGFLHVVNSISTGGKRRITMTYDGLGISLADNSILANFTFQATPGNTNLSWVTNGNSCHYDNDYGYPLWDQPYQTYYINGSVDVGLGGPVTQIDSIVATAGELLTFTVKVWNFMNIRSGTLTLDFDPDVLSFYYAIPNEAFAPTFTSLLVSSGRLVMYWTGPDTSLADASPIAYLVFSNIGGATPLVWFDEGPSCQYINSLTDQPFYDQPTFIYYQNGNLAPAEFIWTGEVSSDWNNNFNWEYDLIPDQFTDVIISSNGSRSINPIYSGNFVVGVQCGNLTLEGSAQLTVSGDFTIDPGHRLEMSGPGLLRVGGDWTNSGYFLPGEGTVEFTGPGDASINQGVTPENYIDAYILTTTVPGMTHIPDGAPGPSGNNAHSDVNIGFNFNYLGINYSQARINTNGWISLNLSGDDLLSQDNTILFDLRSPSTVLAPWWDDLRADNSCSISYKTTGTAPSRVFTVEWAHILSYSYDSDARLNFQVKLHETTNVIEFCYGNVESGTHSSSEGASVGIKDATGGQEHFLEATYNTTHLILPFLKSSENWPAVNYLFTPPVASEMDIFHKLVVSKAGGELSVQRDVSVTGLE